MALQQGSRAAKSLAKFLPNLSGVRFSGSGEWGSGSGKGGGSGGSIRDAGGTFGKMEAAREVGVLPLSLQAEQFSKLKDHLEEEIRTKNKRKKRTNK
uniref:Atpase inhibitor n=1 Tax=Ixodes ricinus TaxID=34613 RepID=V5I031_IXORI